MRFHTYTKFNSQMSDAVDMQALLDQLADFLLQSGFAGGANQNFWGEPGEDADRSIDGRGHVASLVAGGSAFL